MQRKPFLSIKCSDYAALVCEVMQCYLFLAISKVLVSLTLTLKCCYKLPHQHLHSDWTVLAFFGET